MAMRMDPPDPPNEPIEWEWWRRPSVEHPGRTLHARITVFGGSGRVLVQYFGDDRTAAPGFAQRYISRTAAERILERRGWEPFA